MLSEDQHSAAHSGGYGVYLLIWFSLVVFTGLTVAVAGVHFREFAVAMALTIATVKSLLVIFYFMHLKYEPLLLRLMVAVCFVTFVIFIVLTFFDVLFR